MSSRGPMYRTNSTLFLSASLLTACTSGGDSGGGPIDLGTSTSSPSSTSPETPTTSIPTTGATGSTSTGTPTETTTTGSSTDTSAGDLVTSTGPGTSSSGTTEAPPSESCGDAILDPGEACDLGAAQNDDHGACTLTCTLPKCGDNLIWAGKEDCDNGTENNDSVYGGCTTQCKYGPRCGDGVRQEDEECDLGPKNETGEFLPESVPCSGGCRFKAKLVFLSSIAYMAGELKSAKDAHATCQKLAQDAGFDNATNFSAWISDASYSPAKDFTKAVDPYVRPDGVRIADDWDDLILNGPDDGITITETGATLLSTGVWTGTGPDGELVQDTLTCKGWSSSEAGDKGHRGLSGVKKQPGPAWTQWVDNDHWTTYLVSACIVPYHIYCFEQ